MGSGYLTLDDQHQPASGANLKIKRANCITEDTKTEQLSDTTAHFWPDQGKALTTVNRRTDSNTVFTVRFIGDGT